MNEPAVDAEILRLIEQRAPGLAPGSDPRALALGKGGLDMDSLDKIRLLLECEERFGVKFEEEFLNRPSLTVNDLIQGIQALHPSPD